MKSPLKNHLKSTCSQNILLIVGTGLLAGLFYDLYNLIVHFTLGMSMEYHLIGRWVLHLLHGDFIFRNIPNSAAMPYENLVGWLVHYGVALTYAVLYLSLNLFVFHTRPRWWSAVLFSWAFMVIPYLIIQPAMGLGYLGMQSTDPNIVRLTTFSFHTVFGLTLFLGYWVMHKFARPCSV